MSETGARTLFLHAGQLDYEGGELKRIRTVKGSFPRDIKLHLVYNATRSFLVEFERHKPDEVVSTILRVYQEDVARASGDGAHIVGLQLDIDSPTRLLAHYGRIIKSLRAILGQNLKLSITGLPTWMDSPALKSVLVEVDFWVPQLYGALIPDRLDLLIPISSTQSVAREIERVRKLDHPFYAGLAAYGYAILYSRNGSLVALRGDLNPALVANNVDFELIERRPFTITDNPIESEWRYVYRARRECVVDGLSVRSGEYLMLDLPSATSLQNSARIIRRRAGEKLLGLCIFRLPTCDDPTALTLKEIADALVNAEPDFAADVQVKIESFEEEESRNYRLKLSVTNTGSTGSRMGDGAMALTIGLPSGSIRSTSLNGFASSEYFCLTQTESDLHKAQPCASRRANVLQLKSNIWKSGASAKATIYLTGEPPSTLSIDVSGVGIDGREWRIGRDVAVAREGG